MSFNLTDVIDPDQYFKVTVAVNIPFFMVLVLPSLLLCLLCAVALIFAKEINNKIRLFLINIYAGEICKWITYSLFYLAWPARVLYQTRVLCKLSFSTFSVETTQSFMSVAFYAIFVYAFTKYGEKKLKWSYVIPLIVASWMVTLAIAAIPYFDSGITTNNGFCTTDPGTVLFKVSSAIIGILVLVFLGIQVVCTIFTACYIKKNTLEGNTDIKKAVAKVLAYFIISSFLSFFNNIAPVFIPLIKNAIPDEPKTMIVVNYLLIMVLNIPSIATPIITIVLLKPVRVAIKAMIKRACMCCRTRSVHN